MKKSRILLAVVLSLAMTVGLLAGCANSSSSSTASKGAVMSMYLGTAPVNLDPTLMIYNADLMRFYTMIFAGLTSIDGNGKVHLDLAKSYTVTNDPTTNTYKMVFTLKSTKWSDGRTVTADDFVYAWKRILEPAYQSPAASLLYIIKNAQAVKSGDMTIDDLGAMSLASDMIEIDFAQQPNVDYVLRTLASPALAPMRQDVISAHPDWATSTTFIVTDGPFAVKQWDYAGAFLLERSTYYLLTGNQNIMTYVKPFQLYCFYNMSLDDYLNAFNNKTTVSNGTITMPVTLLNEVPVAQYDTLKSQMKTADELADTVYYFNTTDTAAHLDQANVRKALSIALDRTQIATIASLGAKPATGVVPTGVMDSKPGTDFRKVGGDIITAAGDMATAKSLLQQAGVSGGSFTLEIRNNQTDQAIATYCIGVWAQLGFTVTANVVKGNQYFQDLYSGSFDAICADFQSLTDEPFAMLSSFAPEFSGNPVNLDTTTGGAIGATPGITGWTDSDYSALIQTISDTVDPAQRASQLHDAEKMLIDQSPVVPLVFLSSNTLTRDISGITVNGFGTNNLTRMSLANYQSMTDTVPTTTAGSGS